ncbi:ubiquitin-protein ligase (Cullin) isoform 1 [Galdieria sulphuraria]|uniref:Ubiquitin-protein ligase (Cullin) isoform 1 n=1 Tax=Galdieria sulphuraria TaxID=130081 RepID=M2Y1B8_GALSU|nr:ubiquitin-protein ligase (Cullin) isoform 1 [Galdieria sulphuraria]EME29718.1 ubiquitin-protein ligase (Cullin) isoform 1 [Galdieria sulphuraria]|eukprot:XP_005706238.1 ubiquitin-protein ligase (Cullin) isoform 1 [Galdieria sulphuraria]
MSNSFPRFPYPLSFEEGWSFIWNKGFLPLQHCLESGMDSRKKYGAEQWMAIYNTVYTLCTQKPPHIYADQLYASIKETEVQYLKERVLPSVKSLHNEFKLKELVHRWENHKVMASFLLLFPFFVAVNLKCFVDAMDSKDFRLFGQILCYECFRDNVFQAVKAEARSIILSLLEKERMSETVDQLLIQSVVRIFIELGNGSLKLYTEELETPYLKAVAEYCKGVSNRWAEEDSFPVYMIRVEEALEDEVRRCKTYFTEQTEERSLLICEAELLDAHQHKLLMKEQSGFIPLLLQGRKSDLARWYRLFSRPGVSQGIEPAAEMLRTQILQEGNDVVKAFRARLEQNDKNGGEKTLHGQELIETLMEIHERYLEVIITCLGSHTRFYRAIKEAFESFLNQPLGSVTCAELLSTYCDTLLKASGEIRHLSEDAIEDKLEKVVKLFSYLSEKDLFGEFYRKQLSKRLLFQRSLSEDLERSFITKLKMTCGSQYTSKLEGMVTDMHLSREVQEGFHVWLQSNAIQQVLGNIDFNVTVLTTGHWPTYKSDDICLPEELGRCLSVFQEYYDSRTSQRKLRWVHSLGVGTLHCHGFPFAKGKSFELQVSTHQMCILLLFNDTERLSFESIHESLNVGNSEQDLEGLRKYLNSLCSSKYPILRKDTTGNDQENAKNDEMYEINWNFAPLSRRIKIPLLMARINQEEKEATRTAVDEDRRHAIEAAIVRIMKSRRTIDHQRLIVEVSQQLMQLFNPDPKVIKARIEDLITREYIERDEQNSSLYKYVA